jgi:hypothetical protein
MFKKMTTVLHWKGLDFPSVEQCTVTPTAEGNTIRSIISGTKGQQPIRVEYEIHTSAQWETLVLQVKASLGDNSWNCLIEKQGRNWLLDGRVTTSFAARAYPDISLSPFTNTLPINSQPWDEKPHTINVIYLDILARTVHPDQQTYQRMSPKTFHFATIHDSFHADIEVDKDGFVTDYPGLFTRVGRQDLPY